MPANPTLPNVAFFGGQTATPNYPDYYALPIGRIMNGSPAVDPSLYNYNNRYLTTQVVKSGKGTDWLDEIFDPAGIQNHNIGVSGANESSRYAISINYFDQGGIMKYTSFKRYSVRANTEFSVSKKIRIGENVQFAYGERVGQANGNQNESNPVSFAYRMQPYIPVYDIKGYFAGTAGDDLKFAYDNLPATWRGGPERATKWAAGALLGKAYMFQGKFSEAKTIFDAIVASGQYVLMAKYHDNFRAETTNNKESILEVQFSINDGAPINNNGNRGATLNYPYGGGVTTCCGFFQPSQNLVNSFKTDDKGLPLMDDFNKADIPGVNSSTYTGTVDPRLDWTVGRQGIQFLDWGLHSSVYVRDQGYAGPYSPKKNVPYKDDVGKFTTANPRFNTNNYRMIRYSHVLLMLAECEVEIGGLDKARALINQIRTRASNADGFVKTTAGASAANYKIGTYDVPWTDKEVAKKAVRFETRIELAMEGHRYFDLVRWNVADKVMNDYLDKEQGKRVYLKGAKFVKGKHEYFPIPQNEILNSAVSGAATLKQNLGY